jgi:hypothetical protein
METTVLCPFGPFLSRDQFFWVAGLLPFRYRLQVIQLPQRESPLQKKDPVIKRPKASELISF